MTAHFRDLESDFNGLIELMVAMIDARAESHMTPGMEWLNDIQTLSIKLFKQLCSTKNLAYGCVFQSNTGKKIEFIDQGSISILARASIETFLAMHWIFEGPAEQSQFRHALWQYAGLADRANLKPSTDEGRIKQVESKAQMAPLLEFIAGSSFLSLYSAKEIKELKKGNWRVGWSWSSEAVRAGFHKSYFDNVYGHLCGYSHSNYISAMQIGQAQSIADQEQLSSAGLQISVHVLAHFIHFYASTFSPAADLLSASPAKSIADVWHFKAEDMSHIFDQKNGASST
jgi:hypothetical protein